MKSIGDFIKVKPEPLNIAPPSLPDINFNVPKDVLLPAVITSQNAWFFDGSSSTCPHISGTHATEYAAALRPEISDKTSENVVYDIVDIRKPEFMLSLPDEHKQAGIMIKHAAIFLPFDHQVNCCNLQ
jgi:hypothetical protein